MQNEANSFQRVWQAYIAAKRAYDLEMAKRRLLETPTPSTSEEHEPQDTGE